MLDVKHRPTFMVCEEHRCSQMPSSGVHISTECEGFENGEAWGLCLVREATEVDLENEHHLENVGDHIWSTIAEIAYCPYCGEKLCEADRVELREGFYLYTSLMLKGGRF